MTRKIDITKMTFEEIIAYAEKAKQNNRDNNARYYNNTNKTDPEKYELWKPDFKGEI